MRLIRVLQNAIEGFLAENCMRMAAALSYYAVFSLPALLAIMMWVAGFFYSTGKVEGEVGRQVRAAVGSSGAEQIHAFLAAANTTTHGTLGVLIGSCILLVAATGVMVELQSALNDTWQVRRSRAPFISFLLKRLISLGMILTIALLLVASLTSNALLTAFTEPVQKWLPGGISEGLLKWAHSLVTLVLIALVFAAMFKFLPDAPVHWGDVWLGALVTAGLFALGNFLVGLYLGHSNLASTFGAAGSLAIILLWIYYAAMIVLFGAQFTRAWSQRKSLGGSSPAK